MGEVLTFQQIASADDLATREVDMPEWGGSVIVRELTKFEQQQIRKSARTADGTVDVDSFERNLILFGVQEPSISADQYNILVEKSAKNVDRLVEAISELSGMKEDEEGSSSKEAADEFQE